MRKRREKRKKRKIQITSQIPTRRMKLMKRMLYVWPLFFFLLLCSDFEYFSL